METIYKRTAREIKIDSNLISNKNINVKIGAVENRDYPDTVYIYLSFWIMPDENIITKSQDFLKSKLKREIQEIYDVTLKPFLSKNFLFPNEKENIFIANIPENLNYNSKRNFISIELNLHTINTTQIDMKYDLSSKRNSPLFNECIKIAELIGNSKILQNKTEFCIFKNS